jgi:hypothetical protein
MDEQQALWTVWIKRNIHTIADKDEHPGSGTTDFIVSKHRISYMGRARSHSMLYHSVAQAQP